MKSASILAPALALALCCCAQPEDKLYEGFQTPPAEARPMMRWWWNGNCPTRAEVTRELDIMQAAGISGIEVTPIAMPEDATYPAPPPIEWLSREWNEMLEFTSDEARKRGMVTDMIVGSGWPFGGECLSTEQTVQRVLQNRIDCKPGEKFDLTEKQLEDLAMAASSKIWTYEGKVSTSEILFARLVPKNADGVEGAIDLTQEAIQANKLTATVPAMGSYQLIYGLLQKGHSEVNYGVLGATGPILNHYSKEAVLFYLNRLHKISEDTGIPLKDLIRALFCDSIELAGANWTTGMGDLFFEKYGYRIEPFFPFIFYDQVRGYAANDYAPQFKDQLARVRYDYNRLQVDTFLENFVRTFQQFCTDNGLLARYQAYGNPFLMGLMDGNMIADIPEGNNWINSQMKEEWSWSQSHGYEIWNLFAASGAHLRGKKIVSNEAMTNTGGIYRVSLEDIKMHDDMNFISGLNHSVLHGFNYSPPEAGFPGWVRFGTYFNEQNTWWPYFPKWVEYNSRLSWVFQNTAPQKTIAILPPEGDIWSDYGLVRTPYHTTPWHCFRIWESIIQAGSSCDYIGESILKGANMEKGSIDFGPMSYKVLILCSTLSLQPETAQAIDRFVQSGGKLIVVGPAPSRSLAYTDSKSNDRVVSDIFSRLIADFPDQVLAVDPPANPKEMLDWTCNTLKQAGVTPDVELSEPSKNIFQIHTTDGKRDIWLVNNTHKYNTIELDAVFPTGGKTPWVWCPEDGTRKVYPHSGVKAGDKNKLHLSLRPAHSLLLVFEPKLDGKPDLGLLRKPGKEVQQITTPWQADFAHHNGETFSMEFPELANFAASTTARQEATGVINQSGGAKSADKPMDRLSSFAGVVTYTTTFECEAECDWLLLGEMNKGIAEVTLNGQNVGCYWYGDPLFYIGHAVKPGDNTLEIKYTTILSNYCKSLTDNPTAQLYTARRNVMPNGVEGPVKLFKSIPQP